MTALLYHVSTELLALGRQPPLQLRRWNAAFRQYLEDVLEETRPAEAPARRLSYFAFPTVGQCAAYAGAEGQVAAVLRYYRVSMSAPWRAPMTLTYVPDDLAYAAERLACEYWKPTADWRFWEFFDTEMCVEEEVPPPREGDVPLALTWIVADRQRMRQITATTPQPN